MENEALLQKLHEIGVQIEQNRDLIAAIFAGFIAVPSIAVLLLGLDHGSTREGKLPGQDHTNN